MHHTDATRNRTRQHGAAGLLLLAVVCLASASASAQTYAIMPDRSQASYTVSEKVVGLSLPRDAVGVSKLVSGSVAFGDGGALQAGSELRVDLRDLSSDQARRDNFIKRNTLQTDTYPDAVLVPTTVSGLPWPLPQSGSADIEVIGDLTVHGTTKTLTWTGTAGFDGQTVTIDLSTDVTFDDFALDRPTVGPILAVSDPIHLEVQAAFARAD